MTPPCSVLRLTGVGAHTDHFQECLLSHINSTTSNDQKKERILIISNKYFNASVHLETTDSSTAPHKNEEGVILIFDLYDALQFQALSRIHTDLETSGQCGEALRLCIGATTTESMNRPSRDTKEYEENYSRRVLWCLDRGYEYVEADISPEALMRGHNERDKEGFARVVEAVGGTMWSSAVMHPRGKRAVPLTEKDDDLEQKKESPTDEACHSPQDKDQTSSSSCNPSLPKCEHLESEILLDAEDIPEEEEKDEMAFDELEMFIKEANHISEQARSGAMTDTERKQRAEDTAVRLMGLLDNIGFDEDDDCDDSSTE